MLRLLPTLLINATRTLLIAALMASPAAVRAGEVEAHANLDTANLTPSAGELRSIFLGRTRVWRDGTPVTVIVLEDSSPIHKKFCRDVLGLFNHQLRSTWDRKVYSGTGQAPTIASSLEEMQRLIQSTPGAVGYRYVTQGDAEKRGTQQDDQ